VVWCRLTILWMLLLLILEFQVHVRLVASDGGEVQTIITDFKEGVTMVMIESHPFLHRVRDSIWICSWAPWIYWCLVAKVCMEGFKEQL